MHVFLINRSLLSKCTTFAKKRIKDSSGLYRYRGEAKESKMIEDCIIGLIGEWAVYSFINSIKLDCSEPDMKIYKKSRKSFNCDLSVDEVNIHVKSQGTKSAKRYGNSWLLQRHDPVVKNPGEFDLFAFVNVSLEEMKAEVLSFCWAKDVIYGECKVPVYRNTKVAIYLKDQEGLVEIL